MNTIIKLALVAVLALFVQNVTAQITDETVLNENVFDYDLEMSRLKEQKNALYEGERSRLKRQILSIQRRLEKGAITADEAEILKKEAAQKTALNIDNKLAIIDNRIALLERNKTYESISYDRDGSVIKFGELFSIGTSNYQNRRPLKYDRRTTSAMVLAFGRNWVFSDGESQGDLYKAGKSGTFELGWMWRTRIFDNTNWVRFRYGFSFNWATISPRNNRIFVDAGKETVLEAFPTDLKRSEFNNTTLTIPFFLEFGPYKKRQGENYVRYSTGRKFKIGVGGYAGANIGTKQKLRYREGGSRVKADVRRNFNTNDFVYGLSAYVGWGGISVYGKYELTPIFKDNPIDENMATFGIRLDWN